MSVSNLKYQLNNGFVDNWLVAGPQAQFVADLDRFTGDDYKLQIARHYHDAESGITATPTERETLPGSDLTWRYVHCREDHFVDLTAFYHTCHYLRSWAYAQVEVEAAQTATWVLTTNGPADVWVNGEHVHRQEHFHHQIPYSVTFGAPLQAGSNAILVRTEEVAVRECPYALALRIVELAETPAPIVLPTLTEYLGRRQLLERIFEAAYTDRDVFGREDEITVRWPDDLRDTSQVTVRLQTPDGRIFMEAWPDVKPGAEFLIAHGYNVLDGPHRLQLMPRPEEFYNMNVRLIRQIPLWVERNGYSQAPYGTYEQRRQEALRDAARREGTVYSEIAKMELELWDELKPQIVLDTLRSINARADCSDFALTALLGAMHRYLDDANFPDELRAPLEECVLNFKYWMDEPGSDAMCYWSENHQILFHTCEVLAGQLYPDRTFTNVGENGTWHQAKGEQRALSWLQKRANGGFREVDSNCYFTEDVLALSHLADLAENDHVREFAAVVLDKMLFTMALNSYRGVFGSVHGRTYSPQIKGGRLENTSGIGRLAWGQGIFNHSILGTVALACAHGYDVPPIIAQIAADLPDELWSRERHAGMLEQWCDVAEGAWEWNKVTYKTPDYMLCSAQDYLPGQPGYQQHLWQATFGPDAVVFVSHPPCVSEENSHRPNFWHGNVVLPRVAQWKDALVAIHNIPADDWMGFTHAYFPASAFNEYVVRDGWAFARSGDGYLALTAAQGVELITSGDNAYRELRSEGRHNAWFCHMGRAALDGSFADFQKSVLALSVEFDDLSIKAGTLRGDTLAFGWEGPLLRNGEVEPLDNFKHYDNQYCVVELGEEQMDIQFGDEAMRLHFTAPEAEEAN